jgi:hypothetical protein
MSERKSKSLPHRASKYKRPKKKPSESKVNAFYKFDVKHLKTIVNNPIVKAYLLGDNPTHKEKLLYKLYTGQFITSTELEYLNKYVNDWYNHPSEVLKTLLMWGARYKIYLTVVQNRIDEFKDIPFEYLIYMYKMLPYQETLEAEDLIAKCKDADTLFHFIVLTEVSIDLAFRQLSEMRKAEKVKFNTKYAKYLYLACGYNLRGTTLYDEYKKYKYNLKQIYDRDVKNFTKEARERTKELGDYLKTARKNNIPKAEIANNVERWMAEHKPQKSAKSVHSMTQSSSSSSGSHSAPF